MRLRGFAVLLALSLLLALAIPLCAQQTTGDIRGIVHDPSGAVVSGATVSIFNIDQNTKVRSVTTGADGTYVAPTLPVGRYKVVVSASGFDEVTVNDIPVNINDRRTVDVQLKIGGAKEVVNVQDSNVQVNLNTSSTEGLMTGTQIRELAVLSRNFVQLVALQPGVTTDMATDQLFIGASNPTGFSNQINVSVNGNRPTQNSWLIDGADNFDRGANLTLLNYPSIDSIAEFKVLRSNYLPEHGRSSSGEISVVTRGGTNQFHGSAYEFFRNDKLNANEYFRKGVQVSKGLPNKPAPMRWNDWGFTIGGPIKKQSTFFFYSQEWRHFIIYPSFTSGQMPTAAELAGNFPVQVCTTFTNNVCTGMSNAIAAIDPTAAAYIKDIYSTLPAANLGNTLQTNSRSQYYYREESVRIDHNFGSKVTLFGRYLDDSIPTYEPAGLYTGNPLPGVGNTQTNAPGRNLSVHATATLTSNLVNDIAYTYSWGAVLSSPVGTLAIKNSPDIHPTLPFATTAGTVPFLSFSSGQGLFGFGPYLDYNKNHTIYDTLSKTWGHHSAKLGVTVNIYTKDENSINYGTFSFSNTAGCGAGSPAGCAAADATFEQNWANFLLGRVRTFSQNQAPTRYLIHQKQFEWYAQDEWRLRPNFTIDLGVRHSLFFAPTSGNTYLDTFDPLLYTSTGIPAINPATGNYVTPIDVSTLPGMIRAGKTSPYGNAVFATQKGAIAPRIGFAWDPWGQGKTSVRGGFGIFYDSPAMDKLEQGPGNPTVSPLTANYPNTTFGNPTGAAGATTTSIPPVVWGPNPVLYKNLPYSEMFNLDIQHQFTPTTMLDIGYVGNLGRHLIGVVDINMPKPLAFQSIPGYCAKVLAARPGYTNCAFNGNDYNQLNYVRPYLGYSNINSFSNVFTSNYNGLQAQFQKQFSSNSQIVLNYTWSKTLGTLAGDFQAPQNIYNIKSEYSSTDYDRRHVFTASYVYYLPWMKSQEGFVGHVFGGWEASGVFYANSGRHYRATTSSCSFDFAGLGLCGNTQSGARADLIGDPNASAPHLVGQWFNTAAFVNPGCPATNPNCSAVTMVTPPLRPGDSPRDIVVGPGQFRWDASFFKNTKINERFNTQFRAEFFNILNHTNLGWGQPGGPWVSLARNSVNFGKIANAKDPRQIQLAFKVIF
jgi:Carboxypeptidase regulatory-like domain